MKSALLVLALLATPGSVAAFHARDQNVTAENNRPQHVCVHDAQTGRWTCTRVFTNEHGDSTW